MITPTTHASGFGIALSGGTAKVIAHIGVLRAFEEAGLRPDVIVGCSGGSIVAALFASGLDTHELARMTAELNWRRLARVRIPRLGLLSNQGVAELVRDTVGDLDFEHLDIPTYVVTTDLLSGEKAVFSSGPVAPAVQASCSIPQIFAPVRIDGGLYADGGFVEYLPVQTLLEKGCRVNVGVHLGAYADFSAPPRHMLSMVMRTIGIVAARNARESAALADVVIAPNLRGFDSFDLSRAEELVALGYESALPHVTRVRELLHESESWWYRFRERLHRN